MQLTSGRILQAISRVLASQACVLCYQASERLICPVCQADCELLPLPDYQYDLLNHPQIRAGLLPPAYQSLLAVAWYQPPLSRLISALKFQRKSLYARALAEVFCHHSHGYLATQPVPEVILPMPLHPSRYLQRRYNQCLEVARQIGAEAGIPVLANGLKRVKATQPQSDLNRRARLSNLKQAFVCSDLSQYRHVVLFDDVVTTGATVNAAAATITERYPDMQVEVWALCVTPAPG